MDAHEGIKFNETHDWVYECTPCEMIISYTKKTCDSVVERTVTAYPEAAGWVDKHDRLPLHYLTVSPDCFKHPESVLAVVEAWPAAMDTPDPKTGLLPIEAVIMASTSAGPGTATQTERLDLFYRLLRRSPVFLSGQTGK
jgi:hypothetical protein